MSGREAFVDYYAVLQVTPVCDAKTLEAAYHSLAKTYHPDHTGAADTTKFNEVIEAYKILREPRRRADYDQKYAEHRKEEWLSFHPVEAPDKDDFTAASDADDHARILTLLYEKRRENAQDAGVVAFYLQEMLNCSDEHFEFHKWYLKEKGFIVITEHGTLAITVEGVDQVISMARTSKAARLLIAADARTKDSPDSAN